MRQPMLRPDPLNKNVVGWQPLFIVGAADGEQI
jgi:hypothetical protein